LLTQILSFFCHTHTYFIVEDPFEAVEAVEAVGDSILDLTLAMAPRLPTAIVADELHCRVISSFLAALVTSGDSGLNFVVFRVNFWLILIKFSDDLTAVVITSPSLLVVLTCIASNVGMDTASRPL
jgi:hypothetical protein